jgi:carbonic anhydrase
LLVFLAALVPATSIAQSSQDPRSTWRTPWSYDGSTDGAARWGDLEGSDGKVVGVAVLLHAGTANPVVKQLWAHMPPTPTAEHEIKGLEVDPAGLIPSELSYYKYEGSVTAPPCTEGVTWFVLRTPMTVSTEQIAAFARLYPHDVRPVQPLNGRVVEASR